VASPDSPGGLYRPFLIFCGVIVVTAVLYLASEVLIPVAVAFVLAFALNPLVLSLQRRGLKRIPAVLAVVTLVALLLAGIGGILWLQLGNLDKDLAAKEGQIVAKVKSLKASFRGGFLENVAGTFTRIKEEVAEEGKKKEEPQPGKITGGVTPTPPKLPGEEEKPTGSAQEPLHVQETASGITQVLELIGPAGHHGAQVVLTLILVVFMLAQRENLRNRIVRLVGQGSLITTTRAMNEGATRLSKFLLMQLLVNAGFGLLITAGLLVVGVLGQEPALIYTAVLWGVVVGAMRYVPYLGTWIGGGLMLAYCALMVSGWGLFFTVAAWFVLLEVLAAYVAEPLLFGHSTGVSAVALLVGLGFWTWLWGPIGLLLSVPLTVALVVLGRYVPGLGFLDTLLGENPELHPEVTLYQRLLARDADEADELIDRYLEDNSAGQLYEEVLLPALLLAKRDHLDGRLDADDLRFVSRTLGEILEDLRPHREGEGPPEGEVEEKRSRVYLLGCPARDEVDEMALMLLRGMLEPSGFRVEIAGDEMLTSEVLARIREEPPTVVCIASLPHAGLTPARYLCKRIRAQSPKVKIAVGYWGARGNTERARKRLEEAGADYVATTLTGTQGQVVPVLQTTAWIGQNRTGTPERVTAGEAEDEEAVTARE
jgi:predicted PurR-regulated permease PerM/CheY-like chemotaxis protein